MSFQQYPFKGGVPTGTTAQRPTSPATGDVFYNGTNGVLEIYNGTDWVPCSAPSGTPTVSASDIGTSRAYTSGAISFTLTPQPTGGAPLGYTVVATSASTATIFSTTTSTTTPTLSVGTPGTYTFYANSYNGFGTSPNSVPETVTVTTVPQAPTIGSASTSGTTSDVTVTWTNNSNGGKNISAIKVKALQGSTLISTTTAATTSSTTATVTGLTGGQSYTFKVFAENANGASEDSSASNSVTIPNLITIDYLVVAGGGGGSGYVGNGGGGAGGLRSTMNNTGRGGALESAAFIQKSTNYTVTVGGGGSGAEP